MKFKIFAKIFATLIFLIISQSVFADENSAETLSLSLEDAQDLAIHNHPKILSSEDNAKAANERITNSRSAYLPQINGNAVRAYADNNTRVAASTGLSDPTILNRGSVGVGASQLITDFGRTSNLIDAAKFEFKAQKANADLTRSSILLDVARAYYNLLCAQALQKVVDDTLKTRQIMFEQISLLRDAKMKSDLDASIAKQLLDEGNLLALKAKSALDEACATLSETLGYSESKKFKLNNNVVIANPPAQIEPLIQDALKQNPELEILVNKKAAANKLNDADNKSSYPTISVLGYAGNNPIRNYNQKLEPNYATIGINLSVPFFTGGKISSAQKESEYKARSVGEDLITKKNQLIRDITIAFDNVQNAFKNIDLATQMSKNANKTYDLTKARYDVGKSSIVDLSQAQLSKTEAEIYMTNATYEYLIRRSILDYQVGEKVSSDNFSNTI